MEQCRIISVLRSGRIFQMCMDFLFPYEKHACQLMELMGRKNKDVYAVAGLDGDGLSISGIFYCSKGGTVLPFFKETDESIKRPLIDFFTGRKIFCVSGESFSVDFLSEIVLSLGKQKIKERRFFISMETGREKNPSWQINSKAAGGSSFILCGPENSDEIFSMQIDYIKEEVLPSGMSLNLPVERFEMDRLLKKGKIYAVATEGEILCKAQINAETDCSILIGGVFTKVQHRRKGLARMLMENLKSLATSAGKSCVLFVNEDNRAALSLYEKTGFEKIGNHEIVYME